MPFLPKGWRLKASPVNDTTTNRNSLDNNEISPSAISDTSSPSSEDDNSNLSAKKTVIVVDGKSSNKTHDEDQSDQNKDETRFQKYKKPNEDLAGDNCPQNTKSDYGNTITTTRKRTSIILGTPLHVVESTEEEKISNTNDNIQPKNINNTQNNEREKLDSSSKTESNKLDFNNSDHSNNTNNNNNNINQSILTENQNQREISESKTNNTPMNNQSKTRSTFRTRTTSSAAMIVKDRIPKQNEEDHTAHIYMSSIQHTSPIVFRNSKVPIIIEGVENTDSKPSENSVSSILETNEIESLNEDYFHGLPLIYNNTHRNAISIENCENLTLKNLSIEQKGIGDGIFISNSRVSMERCRIRNPTQHYAVMVQNNSYVSVNHSHFEGSKNICIGSYTGSSVSVSNSNIRDAGKLALEVCFNASGILFGCSVYDCEMGVKCWYSGTVHLLRNAFWNISSTAWRIDPNCKERCITSDNVIQNNNTKLLNKVK